MDIIRVTVAALMLILAGCNDNTTLANPDSSTGELDPHQIRYVLEWDLDDIEMLLDGSIGLTTGEGHRITIHQGWLVNYSASLVPCDYWNGTDAGSGGLRLLGIGSAHAAHGGDDDPSMTRNAVFENLLTGETSILDEVTVTPQRYCKLHYVTAKSNLMTRDAPMDLNLEGSSLYVEGTIQRNDEEAPEAFTIDTDLAYGILRPLFDDVDPMASMNTEDGGIEVRIRRRLWRLFEDADLAHENVRGVGFNMLKSLLSNTTVSIHQ